MTTATKTQTGSKIKKGDILFGVYMGYEFSGTVSAIESNQSGYASDANHVMVSIKLDKDMVWEKGWVRAKAGEEIMMDCLSVGNGYLKREDTRYKNITLRQAK